MNDTSLRPAALYNAAARRKNLWFLALCCLGAASVLLALAVGAYTLSIEQIIDVLLGGGTRTAAVVVFDLRAPRIAAAVFAGWGLALAGVVIQCVLKNPLGSPFTLGISNGAAFGAAFAIVVLKAGVPTNVGGAATGGFASLWHSYYTVTLFAFVGGVAATVFIIILARLKKMSAASVILAGVALSSLFVSATVLIQYFAQDVEVAAIVFWTFGDVGRGGWNQIWPVVLATTAATVWFVLMRWRFNALLAGEEVAQSLGVDVEALRIRAMLGAAFLAALIVSFFGVIGFLGLVAPHMARRLVGEDHRFLIPHTCALGAILLLLSDTLGRTVLESGALPVGVVTSFMGAPLFIYLLVRGNGR
jgi:iron complex transport system permease protein